MNRNAGADDHLPDGARVGADPASAAMLPCEPTASSGFGSPGSDFTVRCIDLNDALIRHPQATFVMRAAGESMAGAGFSCGDLQLVDRAVTPQHGHLVIAKVNGELFFPPPNVAGRPVILLKTPEKPAQRVLTSWDITLSAAGTQPITTDLFLQCEPTA